MARSAGSDGGEPFSPADFQINVVQNPGVFAFTAIGEADVIELHGLCEWRQAPGMWLFADIIFNVHDFEDVAGSAEGLLKVVIELLQLADRIVATEHGGDEGYEN